MSLQRLPWQHARIALSVKSTTLRKNPHSLNWSGRDKSLPKRDGTANSPFCLVNALPNILVPGNFRQHGIASSNKIRQELGFQEPVSIADAIRRTIAWEKENPPAEISQEQFDYPAEERAATA